MINTKNEGSLLQPETTITPILNQASLTNQTTPDAPQIITCFPVVTGNGGKHVALNLALTYKQRYPDHKVALVDLNFDFPTLLGLETSFDDIHGIDNLLDKIDSNHLTEDLFSANLIKTRQDIYLLKGTDLKKNRDSIKRHHLETIFKLLRKGFDRVFVAVASSENQSGTVYGLHLTDSVLFILNNNYTNYTVCEEQYELVSRYYHGTQLYGLFNKFNQHSKVEFGDWIYGKHLKVLGNIPFDERAMDGLDWQGGLLAKAKKLSKKQTPYDFILEQLVPPLPLV